MRNLLWLTEVGIVSHLGILSDFLEFWLSLCRYRYRKDNAEFLAWMGLSNEANVEIHQLIEGFFAG
ncbi:MAG TPA: hypothetical protein PLR65_04630 [Anaerolineales bacterium]|nr:hypothetical protein [Anaerolineales bacterium]